VSKEAILERRSSCAAGKPGRSSSDVAKVFPTRL